MPNKKALLRRSLAAEPTKIAPFREATMHPYKIKIYARRGTFLYDSLTGQRFCHWLTELSFLPDTYQRSLMGDD
jgi:hypothetical protein